MGGVLKGVNQSVSGVIGNMNLSPGITSALGELALTAGQREKFNAILLATVDHVSKKQNFNLELEINDLLVRLGNLRTAGAAPSGLPAVLPNMGGILSPAIEKMIQSMVNTRR